MVKANHITSLSASQKNTANPRFKQLWKRYKIDHPERRNRFDLGITANEKLILGDRQITDDTIALVAEHGFEKAGPDSLAEVENAEAMDGDPLSRIAEPTRRLAESERIGIALQKNAAEPVPGRHGMNLKFR